MILIDRGVVEDHLPNHVLDSLVQFKQQCLAQHYKEEEVKKLREFWKRLRHARIEARKKTNTAGAILVYRISAKPEKKQGGGVITATGGGYLGSSCQTGLMF